MNIVLFLVSSFDGDNSVNVAGAAGLARAVKG